MTYESIDYSINDQKFFSSRGKEDAISCKYDKGYDYYLFRGGKKQYIVKLVNDWRDADENIGEIIKLSGELIGSIPHPGVVHGKIATYGLTSGDDKGFKFVVVPNNNQREYFLSYDIANKIFKEAGSSVR